MAHALDAATAVGFVGALKLEQAVLGHRELLEAIRDGDADGAEATMRRHVLDFEEAVRRVLTGA